MAGNDYMSNPLVLWIETFKPPDAKALEYKDLYDGVFLNDVMQQIDQREAYGNVQRAVEDVSVRIVNWDILVKNIRAYYLEVLQQLLIWKLPNIQAICREPDRDNSFGEVRKTLLLILGCAVQCEHKETIVENIKRLDLHVQHAIVEHIKEITDDSEAVLAIDPTENLEAYSEKMFRHITRLIKERDEQHDVIAELSQERDYYMSQAEGTPAPAPTPVPLTPEKHHLAVELAEIKTKLRHTRQELEDKLERVTDLKDELDETKAELAKVKAENADYTQEARITRSLRDELDIVKEKASKVDMYEKEIIRYKERLNELEFYKARTEELREETQILEETRTMLEEQLATSRRRVETVVELESEMMKYRQQIEQLSAERDWDRERIELLTEENARLEFEKKTSMNESASLEQELEDARAKVGNMKGSLSDQLTETSNAKILRMELENQRLTAKLREMQEGAVIHSAEVNLQLEKENQRLVKRIEKLQESAQEGSQKLLEAEDQQQRVEGERRELQQALDVVKENAERHVRDLEQENAHLTATIEVLRERNEKTNDARMKELERENKRLTETVTTKNTQLSKMEFEGRQLQRSYSKLKENVDRISELENENAGLEKENNDLHQKVATLQHTCEKLERVEQEFSDMEVENRKLQKSVEVLQGAVKRKEELEQENINLTVEKQKLERTLENLKGSSTKVAELESEKDLLNKEIQQVRKLLESQKAQKAKQEQLEFELLDLDNENQRVQKTLEVTTKRLQQLEKDNSDLEGENETLQKQIEAFKMSSRKLQDREKESQELEGELERVQKDKAGLEKEGRRLRQALDAKETALDEATGRLQALEHDHKALKRSMEHLRSSAARVKELEKENRDVFTELNADRKTVATLREELVKEKIQSQELSNQLEKLHQELEHIGINRQKLAMAEQSQDENRLKALENLMQETLKKNSEIKDEKIQALETRLEESKKRNVKLQDELREVRRESEMVKQRYEEEVASHTHSAGHDHDKPARARDRVVRTEVHHVQSSPATNPTKEILELKDHLVQLERTNATLMADNSNLQGNVTAVSDQCQKLERQVASLHSQNSQLQGQTTSLQSHNAQLQVENTTLQSKCASLAGEKSELQTQLSNLETEHDVLIQRQEDMATRYKALGRDHDTLQDLHKQLSLEYEALISEHGSLKSLHKSLKAELKEVQDQLEAFLQGKDDEKKIRDILEKERQQLKLEQRSLGNLQMDYSRLRDDHDRMRKAYDRLSKDYTDSLASHKALKSELNALQLKATEQMGELTECKEHLTSAVSEVQKAENRLETMYQVNERLENENQTLLLQIQQLLNQNHDLLTQALNSKDHFAEEEKQYLEKLSELRRQKERLEEKIMEHYKNRLNSPKKNKGIGAMIARKARNIISRAPRRSKSRPDLTTINDNSSQGSGSHGDSMETVGDGLKRGSKSTENLNKDPGVEDDLDGGFRTLSPTPLVPRGERPRGRMSPGSEMLTLEQFLKEANKEAEVSPSPKDSRRLSGRRRSQDDTESRSSENSDHSGQRAAIQRLQAVAAAHHQQQQQQQQQQLQSDLRRISSPVPEPFSQDASRGGHDTSRGGHDTSRGVIGVGSQDPNLSRVSRTSGGSSATTSDLSPPGAVGRVDMLTSTPKADPSLYRMRGVEERGGSLSSSLGHRGQGLEGEYQDDQHKYAVPHQHSRMENRLPSGQEAPHHAPGSQHNAIKLSGPEPLRSPPPLPHSGLRSLNSRELPPTPSSREVRRESLPPMERLDRLTQGPGFEQGAGRPVDPERRRSAIGEQQQQREQRRPMPRSRSVGPHGYHHPADSGGQGGGGGNMGAGRPGEREPESREDRVHANRDNRDHFGAESSPVRRPPPSSQGPPRPYQRPASVLGHPTSSSPRQPPQFHHQDSSNSNAAPLRHLGGAAEMQRMRAEPMVGSANGPVPRKEGEEYGPRRQSGSRREGDEYGQPGFGERPKSVPPHLFNKVDGSSAGEREGGAVNSANNNSHPVAPPRHGSHRLSLEGQRAGDRDASSSSRTSADMSVSARVSHLNTAAAAASSPQGRSSGSGHSSTSSLPSRYSGPGTPVGPAVMNHHPPSGRPPPPSQQQHSYTSPGPQGSGSGFQGGGHGGFVSGGGGRQDSGPAGGSGYGRSTTPGPRHGPDPYGRDGPESGSPYANPQRPQTAMGRPTYHGASAGPQQRPSPGSNPPGPQHPYRPPSSQDGNHGDYNHRPVMEQRPHGNNPTPMARIPPQTKTMNPPPPGRGDPSATQRTAVGDDPSAHDRPKKNAVWLAR
ncbi:uncharacterized protein LOC143296482 [Babylonia areolata]|uniref:uncharacterized protein LOC143296482 n=1 Tax=Babylonia areolata TaxID=304850 RepID=UPI003FD09FAB